MTREERTELAASIAKQLEDATKDEMAPESEWHGVLALVVILLWPTGPVKLTL